MVETTLVQKARGYATHVLTEEWENHFCYHDLSHTRSVVKAAVEIGAKSDLNAEQIEVVCLAAWFHDLGYKQSPKDHEAESARIAQEQLREWGASAVLAHQVSDAILATKMPQSPKDIVGKVLCDADLYHLSTEDFENMGLQIRKEMEAINKETYKEEEWIKENLSFFKSHNYFTSFGQTVLEKRKKKNIKKLKKKKKAVHIDQEYVEKLQSEVAKLKNKIEKDKVMRPDRGIETMFRITSKNHLALSAMADNKANIMISINAIILSVLVSVLFRKFEDYPNLIIPTMLLVFVCLTTIVFAVLATRPNITSGTFTQEDVMNKKTNLLFFGNFHNMALKNYMWGMKEMMKDADFLYGSMIKDIYFLGKVLGTKYKMLRISYTIFMFGFVASILAFIVALFLFERESTL